MQIMNAMNITRQDQSYFARFVRRGAMLIALLLAFVEGAKAQRYYVMYYEEDGNKHYLAISEDGKSLTNETALSLRCYWVADGDLNTALDVAQDVRQTPSTPVNSYNENSRKTLRPAMYPTKCLYPNSSHVDNTRYAKETNNALTLLLNDQTSERILWLMDNGENDTPVLYYYYYKHYIYYDNGWKYATDGYKEKFVKIEPCIVYPPQIAFTPNNGSYQVSLTAVKNSTIYYTINGEEPTKETGTKYVGNSFSADAGKTIKAIAVVENLPISPIAEMILPADLMVKLDDSEDHDWTYFSGVDNEYNTNFAGKLYSPEPGDVQITYKANGGAVSISEPETEFVYYKTLEQGTTEGQYLYTVISNPFSKRPIVDGNVQGFGGWKIIDGGDFINEYKNGDILPLDAEIVFVGLPDNTDSPTPIVLEATWVEADVTHLASLTGVKSESADVYGNYYTYEKEGGTYETNILVLNCNPQSITVKSPCTIMMVEPDGSNDYRGIYTFTGEVVPYNNTSNNDNGNSKIEYTHWNPTAAIDAMGRNFTIGRGMKMDGTKRTLYGTNQLTAVNQILKVESGKFYQFIHYANNGSYPEKSIVKQWVTLGCDYDRAKGDNSKLEITDRMYVGYTCSLNLSSDQEMCRVYGLSGEFMKGRSLGTASYTDSYYMSVSDKYNRGHRYLEIQGGEWKSIAGGTNNYTPNVSDNTDVNDNMDNDPSFTFRMKGGHIEGSVYGGAEFYNAVGTRTFVITGGTINGWVAGGANGTRTTGGQLYGASYVYVGGDAQISSQGSQTCINRAVGGNVFGAGCGYSATSTSGQVTLGTNVVIADSAYVERGVYGGGSYGYCKTDQTSNIYITGGKIDGNIGGMNAILTGNDSNGNPKYEDKEYTLTILGGVYGGACQNKGGNVNIYMTGGTVNGGLYGGSNASGVLCGDVNIKITGGTVGEPSQKTASIYGGGYGVNTEVTGNTNITMTGGTINGSVFGGGNQGKVNSNATVTITGGAVTGNVYGGGDKAAVGGQTKVVVGSSGQ